MRKPAKKPVIEVEATAINRVRDRYANDNTPEFSPEQITYLKHMINNPLCIASLKLSYLLRPDHKELRLSDMSVNQSMSDMMDALQRISDLLEDL